MATFDWSKPLFITATTTSSLLSGSSSPIHIAYIMPLLPLHFQLTVYSSDSSTNKYHLGGIASITLLAIPSLLRSPSEQLLLSEWHDLRARAAFFAPPLALVSASCSFLTAYLTHTPSTLPRTYKLIGAGLSTLCIVPFRFLGMREANTELIGREESSIDRGGQGDEEGSKAEAHGVGHQGGATVELVRWWGKMNLLRALLPLVGTVLAFEAL